MFQVPKNFYDYEYNQIPLSFGPPDDGNTEAEIAGWNEVNFHFSKYKKEILFVTKFV